jgi:hypothetical protein
MWKSFFAGTFLATVAGLAAAQATDPLPKRLSGHWTFASPSKTFVNSAAFDFEGDGRTGPITGKLNWHGVTCGAQDEPIAGTWDGHALRVTGILRANVNSDRMNGQCGDGKVTFTLVRKAGERDFEGEARADYTDAVPKILVSP